MIQWSPLDLNSSNRPITLPEETILFVQSGVGLYNGIYKVPEYQNGVVYLTSHRICYIDNLRPHIYSIALDLEFVDRIESYAGFLTSSPKITIWYKKDSAQASGVATPTGSASAVNKKTMGDWICPICTFTNAVSPSHRPDLPLPPCVNCGMKPPKSLKPLLHTGLLSAIPYKQSSSSPHHPGPARTTFTCPRCTFENHPAITTCEVCGAPLVSRNLPPVLSNNENRDERGRSPAPNGFMMNAEQCCKLSFRSSAEKTFLEKLRKAVIAKAWESKPDGQSITVKQITRKGAGIGRLQNREDDLREMNAQTMSGAFEDLEALMASAKEMVALAESFANRLASAPSSTNSDARELLRDSTTALGLSTPIVTKEMAGKTEIFHAELARQISEFLGSGVLKKEGGAMTLVDLFALYNRARGGNLVSPGDLLAACNMFESLNLSLRLRRFRSGILVVQDRDRNEQKTRQAIRQWVKARTTGASALDAVEQFGWSVGVATEELEMAESYGDLARDVCVEGVTFYDNMINDFVMVDGTVEGNGVCT